VTIDKGYQPFLMQRYQPLSSSSLSLSES